MRELILSAYYHIEQPDKYATNYWRRYLWKLMCWTLYGIISVSINDTNIVLEMLPMMLWNIFICSLLKLLTINICKCFLGYDISSSANEVTFIYLNWTF